MGRFVLTQVGIQERREGVAILESALRFREARIPLQVGTVHEVTEQLPEVLLLRHDHESSRRRW